MTRECMHFCLKLSNLACFSLSKALEAHLPCSNYPEVFSFDGDLRIRDLFTSSLFAVNFIQFSQRISMIEVLEMANNELEFKICPSNIKVMTQRLLKILPQIFLKDHPLLG